MLGARSGDLVGDRFGQGLSFAPHFFPLGEKGVDDPPAMARPL